MSSNSVKPDDMSSDEWEENMLKHSYANYGKMICQQKKKKKQDRKIKQLKNLASDSDDDFNQIIDEIS